MYLGDYCCDDCAGAQLGGLGSKLKKAVRKVTSVITKPMQSVHRVVEAKLIPEKLMPLVSRVHKSIERGTAAAINPLDAPRLVKEEVKQMSEARKDPKFLALVGQIMSVVAIVYPFLQFVPAAIAALKVAAERAAAKKLMAQTQAEADAAQVEFDAYAAELARLQKESEALKATPVAPSPASVPVLAQPLSPIAQPLSPVVTASAFAPRASAQAADQAPASSALPTWALPAGIAAAAALIALPLLKRHTRGS